MSSNNHNTSSSSSSYPEVKRDYSSYNTTPTTTTKPINTNYHTTSSNTSNTTSNVTSSPPSPPPVSSPAVVVQDKSELAYEAHKNCIDFLKKQIKDEKVFFVLSEMERIGCVLKKPFFRCTPCLENENDPPRISAAYVLGSFDDNHFEQVKKNHKNVIEEPPLTNDDATATTTTTTTNRNNVAQMSNAQYDHLTEKPGVILCEDVMQKYGRDENVLLHELIHAYDDCRAIVSWNSCEQLACAEIRASALSGECNYGTERRRTTVDSTIVGGFQKCVQRRAALSIRAARACQNRDAKQVVDKMFNTCYNDIEPFARRP